MGHYGEATRGKEYEKETKEKQETFYTFTVRAHQLHPLQKEPTQRARRSKDGSILTRMGFGIVTKVLKTILRIR